MNTITVKGVNIEEGRPKIAVSICEKAREEIINRAMTLDREEVDILEWRADFYKDVFDIKKVLETLNQLRNTVLNKPVIFTFRSKREGGEKSISIEYYLSLNRQIAESRNVEIIDIETSIGDNLGKKIIKAIQKSRVYVIGSNHDFLETPKEKEMINRLKKADNLGADILKLAVKGRSKQDVIDLLLVTNKMKNMTNKPIITMSMGDFGTISRISGRLFGSSVTFGSSDKASAPGQIPVDKLYDILNFL